MRARGIRANQGAHGRSWRLEWTRTRPVSGSGADTGLHELEGKLCSPLQGESQTAPSEGRVEGSAGQGPVRDTRSLLPVLVNAAGKETLQAWALSTAVLY